MSGIEWNEDTLPTLGKVFLRHVIDHMLGCSESTVRFGKTGQGIMPNYQIISPNGVIKTLRGSSHDAFKQVGAFDEKRISRPFLLAEIQHAFDKA
ncbi:MAG: hypothetical protein EKK71_11860 [Candidatus Competibacteraceae bacterium]|nr:MAG: hypothetical protein EKK71_11860 [Candidatus Competibacteraceae bacterium]